MDLSRVKQVFCKQGEVKRILSGDVVLWEKPDEQLPDDFEGIRIAREDTNPINDFFVGKYEKLTFRAMYHKDEGTPIWSISELPTGLSYEVTNKGLIISGYAEEVGTKEVTITATLGEYSDTKTYTFNIADDGNKIKIANDGLGTWNNGFARSVTLTSSVTGNIEGTPTYYVSRGSSMPSWMSLNQSTGVISGTPNITKQTSGGVSFYVVKGAYKSLNHPLGYRTVNIKPTPLTPSSIVIDVTSFCRYTKTTQIEEYDFNIYDFLEPMEGSLTSSSSSALIEDEAINHTTKFTNKIAVSATPITTTTAAGSTTVFNLQIRRKTYSTSVSYGGSYGLTAYFTLTVGNKYGTTNIGCTVCLATKAAYEYNPSKYQTPFWYNA